MSIRVHPKNPKIGTVGIFSEDDVQLKVQLVDDSSDDEAIQYSFKILKIVQRSHIYKNSGQVGETFSVFAVRGDYAYSGMWCFKVLEEKMR